MSEELASYSVTEQTSSGRKFPEKPHPYRSSFERDRDRIIHSEAFRRLEGKTQVFTPGLNDNYRNRLTHSMEVAQIGRTIAKSLRLNQSLTEAICLAHDLGHSPFGHAGEEAMNGLMFDSGGFEHNKQTLRIVELLEHPYPDFRGLNLMYETRLGLAKHRSSYDNPDGAGFAEMNSSLEGQAADLADRIAYNCHDLEDGLRAGLIGDVELKNITIFQEAQKRINAQAIQDDVVRRIRTAKAIIDMLVSDCIETSREVIEYSKINTVKDVYQYNGCLVMFSAKQEEKLRELEKFLLQNLYLHNTVIQATCKIKLLLAELFEKLCSNPTSMPAFFQQLIVKEGLRRSVCDYVAGMTDRFCWKTFKKFGISEGCSDLFQPFN